MKPDATDVMFQWANNLRLAGKYEEALEKLRTLEKSNHPQALFWLGIFHRMGLGGAEKNLRKANYYIETAADLGDEQAKDYLNKTPKQWFDEGLKAKEEGLLQYAQIYFENAGSDHPGAVHELELITKNTQPSSSPGSTATTTQPMSCNAGLPTI